MKPCLCIFFCCFLFLPGNSQEIKNPFFGLYSIVGGDSVYKTFEDQIRVMKEAGYDGIEIPGTEEFSGMKSALDKLRFHAAYFYFAVYQYHRAERNGYYPGALYPK
jgi:hypothetical protein